MGFFEYIEYLRSKPERTRTRIAFSISFVITALIFTGWMMSLYGTEKEEDTFIAESPAVEPLSSLSGTALNAFNTVKGGLADLKDAFLGLFNETYKAPQTKSFDRQESQLFEY
jgi:hypothetical protein